MNRELIMPKQPRRIDSIPNFGQQRAEMLQRATSLKGLLSGTETLALQNIGPFIQREIPTLSPDNPNVEAVLTRGDYSGIGQDRGQYNLLLRANSLRQQIAREIILQELQQPGAQEKWNLTSEQYILLTYGLQIQQVIDNLHVKFHTEMVAQDSGPEIVEKMKDPAFKEAVLGQDAGDFIYGIVRQNGETEGYQYLTYAEAYPEEITGMTSLMKQMMQELKPLADNGSYDAQALLATHEKLVALLEIQHEGEHDTTLVKRQKDAQKALDTVWDTQVDPSRTSVDILYPMECYAAVPFVEMQYDILFKAPEYKTINDEAERVKQKMLEVFSTEPEFSQLPTLQESLNILKKTDGYVYLRFISGTTLGFRSAASNVPNDSEVRLMYGSKINYDFETVIRRAAISDRLLTRAVGEEGKQAIFGNLEDHLPRLIGDFIAGHEDAHNLLERKDTFQTLGEHNHMLLDETKADLAGLITCLTPEFLTTKQRSDMMLGLIAEELRGLSRWSEKDTDPAHLNGNMVLFNLLFANNIVSFDADGLLQIDVKSNEKFASLRQEAKDVFLELAKAYESKDRNGAHQKADEFLNVFVKPNRNTLRLLWVSGIIGTDEYRQGLGEEVPQEETVTMTARRTSPVAT